ncbi:uncharacterized protein A1O9_00607 [Exophiala aquamarina CBS 119918]|uniref:N-acetyltransferase domain-containing protein n=1 Tax=Exophiala aquamarina CBS 119918 TaxID=1182545 RepID=A0A072PR96_9EURO|nr:uncharacterized protein A1O9_00607 [Exophiala aquamarina CBS 119918]KEF62634.1 hypothetical protein A1O9_00607 [Exophiala aquamarina CBS 119918]
MTSLSAATPSNPTNLPPRYEIRKLTVEDIPWAKAIVLHANIFHSSIWPITYPNGKTARVYNAFEKGDYLIRHQVESGHSLGVFDLEYKFKREESKATGGKLYWDFKTTSLGAEELLEQMDFPLLSIALSYDQINPVVPEKLGPLIEELPLFGTSYHILEELDTRDDSWKATRPNEVLLRNATSSRRDAEGLRLMANLARFLMRYAAQEGFRAIQIETFDDRVAKVWLEPPAPFRSTKISEFNTWEYTEDEDVDGQVQKTFPFGDAHQTIAKVFVELNPESH